MSPPDSGLDPRPLGVAIGVEVSLEELVGRARDGDETAFSSVYQRFHGAVHAVVLARVAYGDADDLVQDVFVEAWTKLGALRDPKAFPGWLMTLARRRAVDRARKSANPTLEVVSDHATPSAPLAEALSALRAIRELPETYRETLIMRLVEGLTGPEIAERTGMTPESVRVHLHRGFKLLRERLGGRR